MLLKISAHFVLIILFPPVQIDDTLGECEGAVKETDSTLKLTALKLFVSD